MYKFTERKIAEAIVRVKAGEWMLKYI